MGDEIILDGKRMRVTSTGRGGVVNRETLFTFEQEGSVVSARYSGGRVRLGHLVGVISADILEFRYAQVDTEGHIDGGCSKCEISRTPDGEVRLLEHFQWESREGSGTNVFEEEPKPRTLPTAAVADACLRLGIELRMAPPGIQPVVPGACVAGRALPARHYGSVDVFLEAMEGAAAGDILVIDNGGRRDEACIGDLVTLEARSSGVAAMVVWGAHRDSVELRRIGLPVFSYGLCLAGPRRLDHSETEALLSARFGDITVTRADMVVADDDGLLFVPAARWDEILQVAGKISLRERAQAAAATHGTTLRQQFRFAEYLVRRATDAAYTFRLHLRRVGGTIEE